MGVRVGVGVRVRVRQHLRLELLLCEGLPRWLGCVRWLHVLFYERGPVEAVEPRVLLDA